MHTIDLSVILLSNVSHILNKTDKINVLLGLYSFSVVCFTEPRLTPDILNFVADMQGYSLVRKDRISGLGGGEVLSIQDDFQFNRPSSLECSELEVL